MHADSDLVYAVCRLQMYWLAVFVSVRVIDYFLFMIGRGGIYNRQFTQGNICYRVTIYHGIVVSGTVETNTRCAL